MIIAFTQLSIVAVWLLTALAPPLEALGKWSLYTQWLVILTCVTLCNLRKPIAKLDGWLGVCAALLAAQAVLLVIELVAVGWASGFTVWQLDYRRWAQFALADLLIVGAMLRFFAFLATMESRNRAESESRVKALQSRIQPHFLFNSLNTISELAATQPEQAEQAINSLAMLFRASLENNRKTHTLANELKLCERYIELERWRVADRLDIVWDVHIKDASHWSIPKLVIQPLVENAILHGVQADGAIDIWVDVRETSRHLSLKIENKLGVSGDPAGGHGIAIDNIRERLIVMYDDQQSFRVKRSADRYSVFMQIPKIKFSSEELMS